MGHLFSVQPRDWPLARPSVSSAAWARPCARSAALGSARSAALGSARCAAPWSALLLLLALSGCDRAPPEPEAPQPHASVSPAESAAQPDAQRHAQPEDDASARQAAASAPVVAPAAAQPPASAIAPACIVPLAETPPPEVASRASCPADPEGRPLMPHAKLTFPAASNAPILDVEVALTLDHQMHGLMFRNALSESQGMLFSYTDERIRTFWMKNTCLALDMIFASRDGTIVGILEQVPPWNLQSRSVPCEATHVLEVPAGWSRRHGVRPGQKFLISG